MGPDVLVPFFVMMMPVMIVFIVKYFRFREKELALRERQDQRLLGPGERDREDKERKQLEARIQNLESIVCSVDFELNQRISRVLDQLPGQAPAAGQLPPAAGLAHAHAGGPTLRAATGPLRAGQTVAGRYTVERELGQGGMGAVYLAQDAKLGERVALKTLSTTLAADVPALLASIRREVQAARRITHPNVVRIHDLHEDGALVCLSMEYIEGETLFAQVRRRGPLPVREALEILIAVSAGVGAAHAVGIVHRDLKPQNILLGGVAQARVIKVIDFGVAHSAVLSGMTATGLIMGTPEYMAPEQVRGVSIDARTDVYALGAVAYFTLCGKPPFTGDTPIAVGFAQLQEAPRPPRELRPEVPAALEALVLRALSKDPAARPTDATALSGALQALL